MRIWVWSPKRRHADSVAVTDKNFGEGKPFRQEIIEFSPVHDAIKRRHRICRFKQVDFKHIRGFPEALF